MGGREHSLRRDPAGFFTNPFAQHVMLLSNPRGLPAVSNARAPCLQRAAAHSRHRAVPASPAPREANIVRAEANRNPCLRGEPIGLQRGESLS